eukprot:TRINITY_DN11933_c0_g2_i1.p2 TRINITY_DN11933_c0_g2~~TRINITY_DN11933_c0_g2_i1.p2  ORF type:complete len:378 (+),score=88.28 TRINITY_DN11933_c0_g2_i1:2216-3349(+)
MSMQLDGLLGGSDVMFGWSSESHKNWLESMQTPPGSPPPELNSLDLLGDASFLSRSQSMDDLIEPLDQFLDYDDLVGSLTVTPLESVPETPLPTPFHSGTTTPRSSRPTSPDMHLNILEDDDLMADIFEGRAAKRHHSSRSPVLEHASLMDSLTAIAEHQMADFSSAELSHSSSCPPSASNSPPTSRVSSAPSSRRGSTRRRKSTKRAPKVTKPRKQGKAKAKSASSEQLKRETHNISERQRRQALKESFDTLRRLVPSIETDERAHTGRILEEAVKYIHFLKQEEKDIEAEKEQLQQDNERIKAEHGIEAEQGTTIESSLDTALEPPSPLDIGEQFPLNTNTDAAMDDLPSALSSHLDPSMDASMDVMLGDFNLDL